MIRPEIQFPISNSRKQFMNPITAAMAKSTATEATKSFIARIENLWGKKFDSIVEKFRDGVTEYLDRHQDRFMWTKTFLHRDPVYFYDIYFPLRIEHKSSQISIRNYSDVFRISPCIAVIGLAGSGKSTLMRHLFLNIIQTGEYEIPLLIELRRITPSLPLISYIESHALGGGLVLTSNALHTLLDEGKIILFFDGFDEVLPECYSSVVQSIDDICTRYPKVKVLVTGRPGSRVESLRGLKCVHMAKLGTPEIKKFISLQKLGTENESRLLGVVSRMSRERKPYLSDYLSNPLLLSLFILTCNTTKQLPDRKSAFYRRVVDTLFVEHDSVSKPDYDRRLRSGLSQVKFEQLLQRFSAVSYFNSRFEFDKDYIHATFKQIIEKSPELQANIDNVIKDLVVSVGLWAEDGGMYSFSHRSLQEYFTAAFIAGLETAKKQEIYSRLITKLKVGKTAEVQNFLSLCQELDEQAYLRFFQIPVNHGLLSHFASKELTHVGAQIVLGLIARVFVSDEGRVKRHMSVKERSHFFGQISWQYVQESEFLVLAQIYPDWFRAITFFFFFEGPLQRLLNEGMLEPDKKPLEDGPFGSRDGFSYDLTESLSESDLAAVIARDSKGQKLCASLKEALEKEGKIWQNRLSELDYADATLITELL